MVLAMLSQMLPASLGVSPDMTAACFCLWKAQVGAMGEIISNEYSIQKRLKLLNLDPGEQYRRHTKSIGGFRC